MPAPYCLFHLDLAYLMQTKRNAAQICSYSLLIPSVQARNEKNVWSKIVFDTHAGDVGLTEGILLTQQFQGDATQMNGHLYV